MNLQKIIFNVVLFTIPFIFFLVFELCLGLFNYGGDLDLFLPASKEYPQYKICNSSVGYRYFYNLYQIPGIEKQYFLKEKAKNGYRIFVLGGSTTAGYPYGSNLCFAKILQRMLEDTFPEKKIEVITIAMTAINSYALVDFIDEIIENQPDAVLIYAGHNEYYGALGIASMGTIGKKYWFTDFYLKLMRYRTFLLARNVINEISAWFTSDDKAITQSGTLMERLTGDKIIPYKSKIYNEGKEQFRKNFNKIVNKIRKKDIPLIPSELVSNIRDQQPFIALNDISLSPSKQMFDLGRELEKSGKYKEAKETYYKAKDLDDIRFRASEEFNRLIYKIAKRNNIPVIPLKKYFEDISPDGLLGNNLMMDHLHPNIDGYFLIAKAFYITMKMNHFISKDRINIKPISFYRGNVGFTGLDS